MDFPILPRASFEGHETRGAALKTAKRQIDQLLAETATNETARRAFENLAATWERLASELESSTLFLQAMEDIEPKASAPIGLNGPMP